MKVSKKLLKKAALCSGILVFFYLYLVGEFVFSRSEETESLISAFNSAPAEDNTFDESAYSYFEKLNPKPEPVTVLP